MSTSLAEPSPRLPYLAGVMALLGFAAFVSVVNFTYAYDDAFITYRIAHNFATGQGFVYNPGNWNMGTTAPLYGLLLGVLGAIVGAAHIPILGSLISSVTLALGGLALAEYGRRHDQPLAGLLAGMCYVTNPMLWVTFSGEMPLQMAIVLWAFVAYRADRTFLTAALLAAAALTRPDGVMAAAVIGGYDLIVQRRVRWREGLLFAGLLLPFVVLAWIYYGSPLPGTLAAKIAQRDSGLWPQSYGQGLRSWFRVFLDAEVRGPRFEFFSLDPGRLSFWALLGLPALLRYRFWWLPLAWTALFVVAYRTLKVPFYHWYAAPAIVGLSIVIGCGMAATLSLGARLLARWQPRPVPSMALVLIGTVFVLYAGWPYLSTLRYTMVQAPTLRLYEDIGRWLHDHTPPDASIGYYEIGYVGYYSQRRMIDAMGLIDPIVPPHIAQRDFSWAYRHYRPTYILDQPAGLYDDAFRREPWFVQGYRERHVFSNAQGTRLTLWEAIAPQPRGAAAVP